MTRYVLGFLIDNGYVVLIRKKRPSWQFGKLNGVGGHIELGEDEYEAMEREFLEETGFSTHDIPWKKFCVMSNEKEGWEVSCFWATGVLTRCQTKTDEEVEIHEISEFMRPYSSRIGIENLGWLLSMIESQKQDQVEFYKVEYIR